MTTRLKQAIERVQALPAEKQEWFADLLLGALAEHSDKAQLPFGVRVTADTKAAERPIARQAVRILLGQGHT